MRIFSGIQPTGRKHLGNYIGAIAQYVSSQERGESIFCIVDLHAITVAYDPAELRERLYDTTAILLAAGLDPERCILFRQSDVPEHTELTWLLSSVTELGRLQRMHQFRDKSTAQRELVSAGLLLYPVLQAADVLAYRAEEVPVGEDQREHLELMRDVARRFNARFGGGQEVLAVPEHRIPAVGARIMDLQEPTRKMSTTGGSEQGTVYVLDEPENDREEGGQRGDRLRQRGAPRARQARGEQPDRNPGGRPRSRSRGRRVRVRTVPLRRVQDRRGWRGRRLPGPGARALRAAARERGRARVDPRRRRAAGAGDRLPDARGRARAHGCRRPRAACSSGPVATVSG